MLIMEHDKPFLYDFNRQGAYQPAMIAKRKGHGNEVEKMAPIVLAAVLLISAFVFLPGRFLKMRAALPRWKPSRLYLHRSLKPSRPLNRPLLPTANRNHSLSRLPPRNRSIQTRRLPLLKRRRRILQKKKHKARNPGWISSSCPLNRRTRTHPFPKKGYADHHHTVCCNGNTALGTNRMRNARNAWRSCKHAQKETREINV